MPLSDTTIRTAKPKDKLYRLTDANGLCLEVTTTGSKLWRYRYLANDHRGRTDRYEPFHKWRNPCAGYRAGRRRRNSDVEPASPGLEV